jgi:hypothetical protein
MVMVSAPAGAEQVEGVTSRTLGWLDEVRATKAVMSRMQTAMTDTAAGQPMRGLAWRPVTASPRRQSPPEWTNH